MADDVRAVDLFAGPGGWDEGALALDVRPVGLEFDAAACETRAAAGHLTIRADVSEYPPERFKGYDLLIASPPCQDFSIAGKRAGIDGTKGELMWQVPHWVDVIRPRFVACEQVPPAQEWFERFAWQFEEWGYRTWVGVLNAADYGVPQTRRRVILMASLEGQPHPPAPTHAKNPVEGLFGPALSPWVSMAEALGWTGQVGFPRLDDRGDSPDGYRERDWRATDEPAFNLTEKARSWELKQPRGASQIRPSHDPDLPCPVVRPRFRSAEWVPVVRTGTNSMKHSRDPDEIVPYERPVTEPAPTVDAKAVGAWTLHTNRGQDENGNRQTRASTAPAPALSTKAGGQWAFHRPATTVVGPFCPDVIAAPGYRQTGDGPRQDAPGSVKITIEDALVLQSFRPDYPLRGSRTKQFEQVGNAAPPRLAEAVLAALIGDAT